MTFTRKITLAIMTASMAGGIFAIANRCNSISFVKGENDVYTLSLNTSNKVTSSGDKIMTTAEGGQVRFTYSDVASSTSGHVTLNSGGTFRNKDIIHSITAFTPTFTGSLRARTSYDAETWSEYFDLVSTTEYELGSNPYYVEFKAINASVLVNSISYKYTCLVNEDVSTDNGEYVKVTNVADLKVGSTVIFTNTSATVAMSTTQNDNNRGQTSVTASSDKTKLTNVSNSVAQFTLGEGTKTNSYSFKDANGFLYAASSSKNYLRSQSTLTDNSSFSVSISSGNATVIAKGSNTNNQIRYNTASSLFSCYSSGQQDICLYQKETKSSVPFDEIGFLAVDANANTYKTSDSWSTASSFSVRALYSDGTENLLSTGYSYQIKNASGTVIDHTQPFTYAGTYTLTVSYKNYIPQNITLLVSGATFDPIVDIAVDDVDGTFTTSSKFSTYLSSNEWGCIVERASEDLDEYIYSEFASNDLELVLINPAGITHDIDTVFGTEGTWTVRVKYALNASVYDETTFEVNIVPVTTITLDHSSATIEIGDTMQLEVSS
ncbi:MAG: hypothetical protein HUJ59_04765, partial [Bacilli bacterium]|nr:hypothetical protein [Bacilli bacterium]